MSEGGGKELNTKGIVAGAGAGTLLTVCATLLPAGHETLSAVLTYLAPGFSVATTTAWVLVAAFLKDRRSRYVADRALRRARLMRDQVCSDPDASPEHQAELRQKVEHLEKLTMAMIQADFHSVDALLKS